MKAGILTFHRANNFGAVLQAYALQQTIKKFSWDCDIIDYTREKYKDVFIWQKNKIKNFLNNRKDKQPYTYQEFIHLMLGEQYFYRENGKQFADFRNKYMQMSQPVVKKTISQLNNQYDLFIAGSDQIWNPGRINIELTYMLDFVSEPNKKGSYAASFGVTEIPQNYLNTYKRVFEDIKYLSVREQAGADIIWKLTGRTAEVVLDPTFLLSPTEWDKISESSDSKNYIIVYQLGEYSETLMNFAHTLSHKTGFPIRLILTRKCRYKADEYCKHMGPGQWLTQIKNARYIVTNSFHGVAFSIIYNKNFFVEITEERLRASMASRIKDLLEMFHLENRLIKHGVNEYWNIPIDYQRVNQRLTQKQTESKSYLKNMLSVEEKNQ
ncbi:putative Polysaccharide pyruvyl transferase [Ruminococcaceae bacterium BL-6]|nr:putative Polysaccharide pyruvyl transferase [Ruminococcaceae bacterium BL-6]